MTHATLDMSRRLTDTTFDEALARVRTALAAEGFGVLTEIPIDKTLKEKIDVDFRRYSILGACNPKLAHKALSAAPEVGLFLPCNVVVAEEDGDIVVSFVNPKAMAEMIDSPVMEEVATDAHAGLSRALEAV